uniref:Ig light chain C region n=1 Tax=Aquarana catesbeiana TaxID=8400 RepID=IGKC_AQUCT|nr:RecName: Full=Ig light chain C region [Aquarana catesbeiana]
RGENVRPTVSIYCPSLEQRNSGSASTVCLVDKFYPGGAQVTWKGDNKVISSGVDTSDKIKDKDNTYSMSSTLTMSSEEFKYSTMTCEVTHPTLTPALAKSFQTSECTF